MKNGKDMKQFGTMTASAAIIPLWFISDICVKKLENDPTEPQLHHHNLKRLDEYGLWIQFINESGQEIFSRNKPSAYPTKYSASDNG